MTSGKDLFSPGAVLRINQYEFGDEGPDRDKYLIGLCSNDTEVYYISALTTSKNNYNVTPNASGCNVHDVNQIAYWYFEPQIPLDDDGFFFELPTYVLFKGNVRKHTYEQLDKMGKAGSPFGVQKLAQLDSNTLKRLLKCVLKARRFIERGLVIELEAQKEAL